jgi:hypothetical protein
MLAAGLGRGTGVFANDYATEEQRFAAVKFLIEAGADVNVAAAGIRPRISGEPAARESTAALLRRLMAARQPVR